MAICVISSDIYIFSEENFPAKALEDCSFISICVGKGSSQSHLENLPFKNSAFFNAESTIDAVFKLKKFIDELRISDCEIFVPDRNVKECKSVIELLFTGAYEVKVQTLANVLKQWKIDFEDDHGPKLEEYLSTVPSREDIRVLQSNLIPKQFVHGYATRYGGISTYPSQASLNMIYVSRKTDSRFVIDENRKRLCSHMGRDLSKFNVAKAVHGKNIWVYEKSPPENYDGIICKTPGVTIAAPAADCNMLLLADPVVGACGAVHVGWKGVTIGIVQEAVKAMVAEYNSDPNDIIATLGPSLSSCCLEFGVEESKQFLSIHKDVVVWKEGAQKPHLDLRFAIWVQLESCGIKIKNFDDGVNGSNPTSCLATCTKCDVNRDFFSYRRDGAKFGNCVCFISVK